MSLTFETKASATRTGFNQGEDLTITKPSGTANTDLLYAYIIHGGGTSTFTPPAGWTEVDTQTVGGTLRGSSFRKIASGEPSDYTWTWTTNGTASGVIFRYSGPADPPVDDNATASSDTSPSVTTTVDDETVLRFCFTPSNNDFVVPAGTTERHNSVVGSTISFAVSEETQATAGATGTADFTSGGAPPDRSQTVAFLDGGPTITITATGLGLTLDIGEPNSQASSGKISLISDANLENTSLLEENVDSTTTLDPA